MLNNSKRGDHGAAEQVLQPFRLVVTYKAGISLCVEVSVTERQRLLLECLAVGAGSAVPERYLSQFAYGAPDAVSALSADIGHLEAELARTMGDDAIRRTAGGAYQLATDKVLLSIPA